MINITNEELIPLKEVTKFFRSPRTGKPTHIATVYRWASKARKGPVLDTVKVGGSRYTTKAALDRFGRQRSKELDEASESPKSSLDREERTSQILSHRGLS